MSFASRGPADTHLAKPTVFLDVSIGGARAERIVIELASNVVPKTCENFRQLCTGEAGLGQGARPLCYKGCVFHRIVPGILCQGGDITRGDGTGGESIYGEKFRDENFALKHSGPGIVSMANSGKNTNSSQFFITLKEAPTLNLKHVVFGKIIDGMDVIAKMEKCGVAPGQGRAGTVKTPVVITDCGQLSGGRIFAAGDARAKKQKLDTPAKGLTWGPKVRTFFDIDAGGKASGRIVFELHFDVAPRTCENFRALCTGECGIGKSGRPLHYWGMRFHRIIPGFMCQGGDYTRADGTGGESIWGDKFGDENFTLKHEEKGTVSMANSGPHTNGSQFFITTAPAPHLDDKHVVFATVVEGLDVVEAMEALGTEEGTPTQPVKVLACGQLS